MASPGRCPGSAIDAQARERLIGFADGDARRLLNAVEILATAAGVSRTIQIDAAFVERTLASNLRRFDKGGEQFYDQISALHKSVRGSHADAALYWLVRMLDGGADPLYLGRRIVRMAVEDVGLADPRALRLALDACETYERLGSPEGELALAEAVIYLAVAAKSNAVYAAYNAARAFVAGDATRPVPMHLRNAPTRLMKGLGYGKGYRYAHDEEGGYAAGESYFPDGMPAVEWYRPVDRGLEERIREKMARLREPRRCVEEERRVEPLAVMLDIQLLRNRLDDVVARLETRGFRFEREAFLALEAERKTIQTRTQELQAARNAQAKKIGQAKSKGEDTAALDGRGRCGERRVRRSGAQARRRAGAPDGFPFRHSQSAARERAAGRRA